MGFLFLLAAVKGLRKKKKVLAFQGIKRRSRRRVIVAKPDSKLSGIEKIPDDLLMDILVKVPAKVVFSSMRVSKLWYSLISSRHFTNLFLETSASANPMRSIVSIVGAEDECKYAYLSSSSSTKRYHEDRKKPVCRLDQVLNLPGMEGYFVNALRGLLCVRLYREIRICNLTTYQYMDLPIVKSQLLAEPNHDVWSSFGYDPVHDEYKVLNIVSSISKEERIVRSEHQVFVLGPKASWRNTKSHTYPHRPHHLKGIFIKGAFYYRVFLDQEKCAIMSFDFVSEEFKLIELPIEIGDLRWDTKWSTSYSTIMNYKDKIALFEYSIIVTSSSMGISLWVMEELKNNMKWSKITIELPLYQMGFVNGHWFFVQGAGRCNEVVLVNALICTEDPIPYFYFYLENNKITKISKVCLPKNLMHLWDRIGYTTNFWEDNVENLMRF